MSPETAKWYLEQVNAYLLTPEIAQEKYQFSPQLFLEILKKGFGVTSFIEAKVLLEQIAQDLFAQNIPDPETLRYWQLELEKNQEQKRQITEKVAKEIEAKITLAKKYRNILQGNVKELATAPDMAQKVAWQLTEIVAAQLPKEPKGLTSEKHLQISTNSISPALKEAGYSIPQVSAQNIAQQVLRDTLEETTSLINARAAALIQPEIEPQAPKVKEIPRAEETLFIPEVKEKMAKEEEGVAFVSVLTLLNPLVAASFVKKVGLAPVVKTLQFLDILSREELKGEMTNEWREMLHQGVTSGDIQVSLEALYESGAPPEHPQVRALQAKKQKFQEYEQTHPKTHFLLKHYHEFTKLTGRRQVFSEEIKAFLPRLSPAPSWFNKFGQSSYSLRVRNFLGDLGSRFFFYEKETLVSGKTVIHFALPDKMARVLSFGRVQSFAAVKSWVARKTIRPIFTALGKTALGQGVKKGAAWLLTRLGLATIPTGVTQAIAVGSLIKDALGLVKKLLQNPALLIVLGITAMVMPFIMAILPILVPILLIAGGVAIAAGIIASAKTAVAGALSGAGSFLGGLANTASGLLSSLSSLSVPAIVPGLAVAVPAAIGITAVVALTANYGSFLKEPTREVGLVVPYGACNLAPKTPGAGALKELIISAAQWAGIPPAVLSAVASIEGEQIFKYSEQEILRYSAPGAQIPDCKANGCGAWGPMQILKDGVATDCGEWTGEQMPDNWTTYKEAVNRALPNEQRVPEICNVKDSLYAAALMIKTLSNTTKENNCVWEKTITDKVSLGYYGSTACSEPIQRWGGKTYCQYVWDYYKDYGQVQTPSPSGWFFWQSDPQWNPPLVIYDTSYGTISLAGCGPTSLAMILTYFGIPTNPITAWNEVISKGYMTSGGVSWSALVEIPRSHGLVVQDLGKNWGLAEKKLQEGNLILASTNLYSAAGHILVIRSIEGNNIVTNDSARSNGDGYPYTKQNILMLNLWSVGK